MSGKTLLGKKPFVGSFVSGKPIVVLGKTCLLFGAYRGRSPFLAIYSLPIFGRFLRRKNPFGKKPLSCWETPSLWHGLALLAIYSLPVFGRFLRLQSVVVVRKKPILGEKPLCCEENPWLFREKPLYGGLFLGKPIVILGKTYVLFGARRGSWPLLRLQSAVNSGKTLLGKKPLGKTHYLFGENLF